jgi:hypothetical protein
MIVKEIKVQFTDDGNNPQTLELDGVLITFECYTNKFDGSWYIDFYSVDGTLLIAGVAIVAGLDLWYPYRYKVGIPPGQLFVLSQTGTVKDPTLTTFADAEAILAYWNPSS